MNFLESHLNEIINFSINSVKPGRLIESSLKISGDILSVNEKKFNLNEYGKVYVVGAGKASAYMAKEIESLLGAGITGGAVVVKYGHSAGCKIIQEYEAGHPVVDEMSLYATEEIIKLTSKMQEDDLAICLLSGGGSALLEKLPVEITLQDYRKLNNILLKCGAGITEINTIRKHISQIKGGGLAKLIHPATCLTLIISDVIGDSLETIASGPTYPDSTTFPDALAVIEKYDIESEIPVPVISYLEKGAEGKANETLKPGDAVFENVFNMIIGSNIKALSNAKNKAVAFGYDTRILTSEMSGETRDVAKNFSVLVKDIIQNSNREKPVCLLAGGETTVTVTGTGKGGRNQEFVLASLLEMKSISEKFVIASVGTDGTDGPTDAAGGFIDNESWKAVNLKNLHPEQFLKNNDAYNLLKEINGLIKTGPTGTNVMDLIIALIP